MTQSTDTLDGSDANRPANRLATALSAKRPLNALGALICAGLIAYALYAQYGLVLDPCPLCVFQRIAVILLGIVFLAAALHGPTGRLGGRVYAGLLALVTAGGVAVAGRHIWLQSLPPEALPACGPGLGYILDTFPLGEALAKVFSGSGECAEIDWQFLGLSMPAWVLIAVLVTGGLGVWNNLRRN